MIFCCLFFVGVTTANACSCVGHESVKAQIESTDIIFSGEAISSVSRNTFDGFSLDSTLTTFRLKTSFKGDLEPSVEVLHYAGSGAACGVEFKQGRKYLVLAHKTDDGDYITSLCSKDGVFSDRDYYAYLYFKWNKKSPWFLKAITDEKQRKETFEWEQQDYFSNCKKPNRQALEKFKTVDPALVETLGTSLADKSSEQLFDIGLEAFNATNNFTTKTDRNSLGLHILLLGATKGNAAAMNEIGASLAYCSNGVQQNLVESRLWLDRAAELGNELAMLNIGMLSLQNIPEFQDRKRGIAYIEKCVIDGEEDCRDVLNIHTIQTCNSPLKYFECRRLRNVLKHN